ncbi:DUF4234 domain-containing protein [Pseudoalteromonas sp. TB64]|uniref:DUF4234 domain-containing protein n=1 Tax=Pseudoalteromonas sp. TB64 TaxID=1938600 RepID=UPI00041A1A9F|nr:DUF4234 domain-containing protein [Pseudoalteromonas sp. TB64]
MSEGTENIYEAPESNLSQDNDSKNKPILEFERFSAWGVFFLTLITLGIYGVYWLYSRINKANTLAKNKVNKNLLYGYLAMYVINFALSFATIPPMLSIVISLTSMVLGLVVIFSLRSSFIELINEGSKEPVKLGGILTVFFNIIYFQYKINEAIDNQK